LEYKTHAPVEYQMFERMVSGIGALMHMLQQERKVRVGREGRMDELEKAVAGAGRAGEP